MGVVEVVEVVVVEVVVVEVVVVLSSTRQPQKLQSTPIASSIDTQVW